MIAPKIRMFWSHIDKKSTKSEGRGESSTLVVSEGPELHHWKFFPMSPEQSCLAMNELQEAEISCNDTGHVMWYRLPELSLHPISPSHYIKEVETTTL